MNRIDKMVNRFRKNNMNIEVHTLTPYHNASLSHDEMGRIKTSIIGGTIRSRISSQSIKTQIRDRFDPAIHTKYPGAVMRDLLKKDPIMEELSNEDVNNILDLMVMVFKSTKEKNDDKKDDTEDSTTPVSNTKNITAITGIDDYDDEMFNTDVVQVFSVAEITSGYKAMIDEYRKKPESIRTAKKQADIIKHYREIMNAAMSKPMHNKEISMFGRMVTQDIGTSVDSNFACAHSFGIGKDCGDSDFYAVREQYADVRGAATLGDKDIFSMPFYGYARIHVNGYVDTQYGENPSDVQIEEAADDIQYVVQLITSTHPGTQQNSNATCPERSAILVVIGNEQPMSAEARYESAVVHRRDSDPSIAEAGTERLIAFAADLKKHTATTDERKKYLVIDGPCEEYAKNVFEKYDLSDVEVITYREMLNKIKENVIKFYTKD